MLPALYILLFPLSVNAAVYTRLNDWPGFKDLPECAYYPVEDGVFSVLDCGTNVCVCNRFDQALTIVESIASTKSNCPQDYISSATSVLSGFCRQLPSVTFAFTGSGAPAPPATTTTPAIGTARLPRF